MVPGKNAAIGGNGSWVHTAAHWRKGRFCTGSVAADETVPDDLSTGGVLQHNPIQLGTVDTRRLSPATIPAESLLYINELRIVPK